MSGPIAKLQREILRDYAGSVGLPAKARYYGGARLRPVVPLDTAVAGVFILGAYPSAQFETVGAENDVPVGDNLGPFEPQRYFDGRRVRTQASADELAEFYLVPLGISRSDCWVTDIVKVFLFKEGHREKYARLGATPPARYERERFEELASRSLPWIERELELARPKLVITLGAEIAGIVRSVASPTRRNALLGPGITSVRFGGSEFPTVHLAHPGIVMRKGDGTKNPWPRLHEQEHIPALKAALAAM
jgi:uracil-DNA glycosylase